jgi:molybdenum cofactor synthesis domain-containing protein
MKKTVSVDSAVGMVLPHDITEIVKDRFKGTAFKKGHIIQPEDVGHLKRLGKEHIYVLELGDEEIHENEAARMLAKALAGEGVVHSENVEEGKVTLRAEYDGLLKINRNSLLGFNLLGEVMCSTLHDNTPVKKGEIIAGTRMIPLVGRRQVIKKALARAHEGVPVVRVLALQKVRAGLVITGSEVFYGRIEDQFEQVLRRKLSDLGSEVAEVRFAPDDPEKIAEAIRGCLEAGCDMIVTSGGMSVDPDDLTMQGIREAGAVDMEYGTPVLPGAMFLVARIGHVPVMGLPACGMFHKITVFDLILPRVLAGESIGRQELAELGHGGLCRNCKQCRYPGCNFGK